jgi:hypothetical protein
MLLAAEGEQMTEFCCASSRKKAVKILQRKHKKSKILPQKKREELSSE